MTAIASRLELISESPLASGRHRLHYHTAFGGFIARILVKTRTRLRRALIGSRDYFPRRWAHRASLGDVWHHTSTGRAGRNVADRCPPIAAPKIPVDIPAARGRDRTLTVPKDPDGGKIREAHLRGTCHWRVPAWFVNYTVRKDLSGGPACQRHWQQWRPSRGQGLAGLLVWTSRRDAGYLYAGIMPHDPVAIGSWRCRGAVGARGSPTRNP